MHEQNILRLVLCISYVFFISCLLLIAYLMLVVRPIEYCYINLLTTELLSDANTIADIR